MKTPTKILLIAPSWVGDMLMADVLLQRIKQMQPDAQIDVLAPRYLFPLLERLACVHAVLENTFAHGELRLRARFAFGLSLRKAGYTQVIVLPNSLKSALIAWFAQIPLRTGFVGECRYVLLNDARRLDKKALPQMVQRFALLAEARGTPCLSAPVLSPKLSSSLAQQQQTLQALGLSVARPILVLCPAAEYGPAKRWPTTHFAQLAQQFLARNWQVWVLGGAKDVLLGAEISQIAPQVQSLCGKTTLAQVVDLLAVATQVVSNDSGLMHITAALDKPMVALYGSSSPDFTPPLSPNARVLSLHLACSPCFKRSCPLQHLNCLQQLSPDMVAAELDALAALALPSVANTK